jgi:acetyltransferase-like isoleucine patch superfamily enzyme
MNPAPGPRRLPFAEVYATPGQVVLTLAMYAQLSVLGGIAATPGVYGAILAWQATSHWSSPMRVLAACCLGWGAFFCYLVTVIFVVGAFRFVTRARVPVGEFSFYSFKAYQWASYNALILLVRYSCLNFMRVTPFLTLFHRLMGMKIGARVQINTSIIGDSSLIEIGDDTLIGGDVTLVAHAAEGGRLATAPVRIGSRVTVGLMAVLMPGVTIGDGATIAAGAILPKGTQVGPGELWGGVPARKLGERLG